jgi:hypothetical protein
VIAATTLHTAASRHRIRPAPHAVFSGTTIRAGGDVAAKAR